MEMQTINRFAENEALVPPRLTMPSFTPKTKEKLFADLFSGSWDLVEPLNTDQSRIGKPLHETLFSFNGFTQTKYYKDFPLVFPRGTDATPIAADLMVRRSAAGNEAFLGSSSWFSNNRYRIRKWTDWCYEFADRNYAVDDTLKVHNFLKHLVDTKRAMLPETTPTHVAANAVTLFNQMSYMIPVLERIAKWQGYVELSTNLSKKDDIDVLYSGYMRKRNIAAATTPVDYAATSRITTKRLKKDERESLLEAIWTSKSSDNSKLVMRRCLEQLVPLATGRRGEDTLGQKFAMFTPVHLDAIGPVECYAFAASLRDVKERRNNSETLIGFVRAKDPQNCPQTALALNLVWLLDCNGHQLLHTMLEDLKWLGQNGPDNYDPKWRKMYLVYGDDPFSPLSYSTHYDDSKSLFSAAGIENKKAVTSLHRNDLACRQSEAGVAHLEVRIHQGWEHSTDTDVYLRGALHSTPMLTAVGWKGVDSYFCWYESKREDIPKVLLDNIIPGVNELLAYAKAVNSKCGGDRSAVEFLKVLQRSQQLFCEASVQLYHKYPSFPAFREHRVFNSPGLKAVWSQYAAAERQRVEQRASDYSQKDANVMYQLSELRSSHASAMDEVKQQLQQVTDIVKQSVSGNLSAATPSVSPSRDPVLSPQRQYLPLPPIPESVSNMSSFYAAWVSGMKEQIDAHIKQHNRCYWSEVFGLQLAKIMKKRYHKIAPWVEFLDGVSESAAVISVMEAFAKEHKIKHSKLVKTIFYHMRRPETMCSYNERQLCNLLKAALESAGYTVPSPQAASS